MEFMELLVSVPIRGLFNLTLLFTTASECLSNGGFRPHQGII